MRLTFLPMPPSNSHNSDHASSTDDPLLPSEATPASEEGPDFSRSIDGLLPVIAQDASTGRVLMMAWMNEAAFEETLATGRAVYFSRSRGRLWRKGETSGHHQSVLEIRVDCDRDTILLQVQQTAAACHNGYESCFYRRVESDQSLTTTDKPLVDPNTIYPSTETKTE